MFSVCYRYADVAELADALDLGSSGRPCRFNSCHPQAIHKKTRTQGVLVFLRPGMEQLNLWFNVSTPFRSVQNQRPLDVVHPAIRIFDLRKQ